MDKKIAKDYPKCIWKKLYEKGSSTTFDYLNAKLERCIECDGYDIECWSYRTYLKYFCGKEVD